MDKVMFAKEYGERAHGDQVRKYTGEPYWEHPLAVAALVTHYWPDAPEDVICAALLHDVVEDTPVELEEIRRLFGDDVATYVWFLTKPPAHVGNRETRKKLDRVRLAEAPAAVRYIKMLDVIHNAQSIKVHDKNFWQLFREEAMMLFSAMKAQNVVKEIGTAIPGDWVGKFIAEIV